MRRILAAAALVAAACSSPRGGSEAPPLEFDPLPADPHSYSRPNDARVVHMRWTWRPDFDARTLHGVAELHVRRRPGVRVLTLDSRGLVVERIGAGPTDAHGPAYPHRVGAPDPVLGAPLEITLPPSTGDRVDALVVTVVYRTSPDASGLQWLEPAQTHDKSAPYLFSQAQAIHARSFLPCQDSPGVRFTYDGAADVPERLTAVMSAEGIGGPSVRAAGRRFYFRQERPLPAYLVALAVGDLAFRATGPRTGVWSEPGVVEAAASEFRDLEAMVDATEELYGPYRWGRYDVLVLPPSFPFGGMENPNMTFATPTLLAGDRSLVSVIAHELAHSWSGNLVTNADWSDFWLNEGFTVYLERRIVERLYGVETATRQAILGRNELAATMDEFKDRPKLRRLKTDLAGEDPDDGMNSVPYEKGCLLLVLMERLAGRDRFDPFLRAWFDAHAFRSASTAEFVAFAAARLPDVVARIDLARWIDGEDLPPDAPEFDRSVFAAANAAARDFAEGRRAAKDLGAASWTTDEWLRFLAAAPDDPPASKLAELDAAWGLTGRGNAEVAAAWLARSVRAGYEPSYARLEEFLVGIGRRKFLKPLYAELLRTPDGRARAEAIYRKARPGYHPIAQATLDRLFAEAR
ncbi:MAG TPA: M1 family metallopeptidase [Planctomycetota bacterium]|nr:M1 family metallopeptidase [Planctomycetota bacterium]